MLTTILITSQQKNITFNFQQTLKLFTFKLCVLRIHQNIDYYFIYFVANKNPAITNYIYLSNTFSPQYSFYHIFKVARKSPFPLHTKTSNHLASGVMHVRFSVVSPPPMYCSHQFNITDTAFFWLTLTVVIV